MTGYKHIMDVVSNMYINNMSENANNEVRQTEHNMIDAFTYAETFTSLPLWQLKIFLAIVYGSGSTANSLLLAYLLYYKRYNSPVFCAILSLCVSDLGVCIAGLMWLGVFPIMFVPPWMCNVTQVLMHVSFLSSSYHMVIFATLRFFQLVFPLASRARVTVSLITKTCISIWTADIIQAFAMTNFFKAAKTDYNNETIYVCRLTGDMVIFLIWVTATWVILPFLTTAGFHFSKHAILIFRRSSLMLTSSADQSRTTQNDSRALAVLVSLYLVSILPVLVQYLRYIAFVKEFSSLDWILFSVFEDVAYINSSINPWIYMFAAKSVRSDIRNMCVHRKD